MGHYIVFVSWTSATFPSESVTYGFLEKTSREREPSRRRRRRIKERPGEIQERAEEASGEMQKGAKRVRPERLPGGRALGTKSRVVAYMQRFINL